MRTLMTVGIMIFVLISLAPNYCGAGVSPPLPDGGFRIVPPAPNIPDKYRHFSNKWTGNTIGTHSQVSTGEPATQQEVLLAVEEISPNMKAKVYLSWGDVQGKKGIAKAGGRRFTASFTEEGGQVKLHCSVPKSRWIFTFLFQPGEEGKKLRCIIHVEAFDHYRSGELLPMP